MNISSFQIQNVIKAYGQRIERSGLSRLKRLNSQRSTGPDRISISAEAKKKQLLNKVADGLIEKAKFTAMDSDENSRLLKRFEKESDKGNAIKFMKIDRDGESFRELHPDKDLNGIYSKIEL